MTHSELGRAIKGLHPGAYDQHPDEVIGKAAQRKFAPLYDSVTPDKSAKNPDNATVPEIPRTLRLQLNQLRDGLRKAVFVPRGSKIKVNPKPYGAVLHRTPAGDVFFNPKMTNHKAIDAAFANHNLNDLLGDAQLGYGAPNKQSLQPPVSAAVARDHEGTVAHGALTDQPHTAQALEVAQRLTPPGGHAGIESPDAIVQERNQPEPPVQNPEKPPSQENHPLDADQMAVRERFGQYIDGDLESAVKDYTAKHGNLLVPNFARKLSPDYRKNPPKYNDAVHPAALRLVDELYRRAIMKPGPGDVIITAGGTGSGKTSALPKSGPMKDLINHAKVVREMHFDQPEKDKAEIDAALQAGNNVIIVFVKRGAADAFFNGVIPRTEKTGVPVSIAKHAETHAGARVAYDLMLKAYQGNPHVHFLVIDNDHGPGKAQLTSGPLPPDPPVEQVKSNLNAELEKQARAGKIDQTTYRSARGDADPTSAAPVARNAVAA